MTIARAIVRIVRSGVERRPRRNASAAIALEGLCVRRCSMIHLTVPPAAATAPDGGEKVEFHTYFYFSYHDFHVRSCLFRVSLGI